MKKLTITAIAAVMSLAFSAAAMGDTISKEEYNAAKKKIETEYQTAKAGCDALVANAKDMCTAAAKGKESVALAELGGKYQPNQKAPYEERIAKAEADYSVAKEKCDDKAGSARDVCVKEAQAAQAAAKADAKAQ